MLSIFETRNDVHHWPQIFSDSDLGYIFHQDYLENKSFSPKFEPQDAHFSSKQTSLHCTVVHDNEKDPNYRYHINEDKGHCSSFTLVITKDLMENFNNSKNHPLIHIKSYNCSQQYCYLHVFESYLKVSKEIKKPVILCYGVNGYGWGLVDALSGFGVKSSLRQAIVTDDFCFNCDIELVDFLEKVHEGDERKYFKYLPSDYIDMARKERGDGVRIDGCRNSRMIAMLFPNGTWKISWNMCSYCCKQGWFDECVGKLGDHAVDDDLMNDEPDLLDEQLDPEMFTFIIEGSYIALHSAPKSLELFYLLKVVRKTVADNDKIDIYGHTKQNGLEYIGYYLEKVKETKRKAFYKQLNKLVYVYPGEIFCLAVPVIKDGLHMTVQEYQFSYDST